MPAPSTLVFDAYDFTNWSKSGAPGYQTNQPQLGAIPRFNILAPSAPIVVSVASLG
jgi:hypothetical protein